MTHSPVIKKKEVIDMEMAFPQAVQAIMDGKKVSRGEPSWDAEIYVELVDDRLCISYPKDGKMHPFIISDSDMFATDWYAIN
jgi:hypothetical protein